MSVIGKTASEEVILAGRRINGGMRNCIAARVVKLLIKTDRKIKNSRL